MEAVADPDYSSESSGSSDEEDFDDELLIELFIGDVENQNSDEEAGQPRFGGYENEFVDEVSNNFKCPVCLLPMRDAVQTIECGHRFCEDCLHGILRFAVSFIYWGTSFTAPFLGGNIYLNVFITAVASVPAYIGSAGLALRFGRRKVLVVSFLFAAVGAIGALLLSEKEDDKGYFAGKIFMSMFVARCSAGIAFVFVYVFSAELFPTTLRNVAMGTSTASARLSAFASAYAPLLISVNKYLPFGIMGGLALAAAIVCITLPETHNKPTMENLVLEETPGKGVKELYIDEKDTIRI